MLARKKNEGFLGDWQVREHAFLPGGAFLGCIDQKRSLYVASTGKIRIVQACTPQKALKRHPLSQFDGIFEFLLEKQACYRQYKGPDVLGWGHSFGPNYLVAQGFWPRFGYNFRSWSVMLDDKRQLTGGTFFRARDVLAVIIGIGVQTESPALRDREATLDLKSSSLSWKDFSSFCGVGEGYRFHCENGTEESFAVERSSTEAASWSESKSQEEFSVKISPVDKGFHIFCNGKQRGSGFIYGPSMMWEAYGQDGTRVKSLEVFDEFSQTLCCLREWYQFDKAQIFEGSMFSKGNFT
mgnify:CR=1 FL=1